MRPTLSRIANKFRSYRIRWRLPLISGSVVLSVSSAAAAERVQLAGPETPGSDVEEVLVRAHAELGSVGFSVVRCPLEESTGLCAPRAATGRLEVNEDNGRLILRAWAQGEMAPLTQELDLGQRGVSAEVAAIRAVELLRAMLLLSLREGNFRPEDGGSVQRFTAWGAEESESEPESEPEPSPEPIVLVAEVAEAPEKQNDKWAWAAGIGPSLSLPGVRVPPGWGGEFFVDAGRRSFYFGAAFDAALIPSLVQRPEGRTDVSSISAVFRLGWTAPCGEKWVCRVGPHLGILQFDFQASESEQSRGSDARHLTYVFGGDATVAHYFLPGFGVFLRVRSGVAGRSARLELSDPVVLGRPLSGVSLGATFR